MLRWVGCRCPTGACGMDDRPSVDGDAGAVIPPGPVGDVAVCADRETGTPPVAITTTIDTSAIDRIRASTFVDCLAWQLTRSPSVPSNGGPVSVFASSPATPAALHRIGERAAAALSTRCRRRTRCSNTRRGDRARLPSASQSAHTRNIAPSDKDSRILAGPTQSACLRSQFDGLGSRTVTVRRSPEWRARSIARAVWPGSRSG